MKNNIILLLVVMYCWLYNTSLCAQDNNSLVTDLLQNKNWVMWFPTPKEYTSTAKFSLDTWTSIFSYKGEDMILEEKYYLSDSPDLESLSSNKKRQLNGKFIISENRAKKAVFEILKLTPDSLILKNLDNSSILTYFSKVKR